MSNTIIATERCYTPNCGATMEGRKGQYHYTECGLKSVYLKDILVFHCPRCNQLMPEIPAAGVLHRVIALRLLGKKTLLSGDEMRYLRKFLGFSTNEFVEIMGAANKTVVSKWETKTHGKEIDRIVRLLVLNKLVSEVTGNPKPILQNVTAEKLISELQSTMKLMESRIQEERYEISPEELANFGGDRDYAVSDNVDAVN